MNEVKLARIQEMLDIIGESTNQAAREIYYARQCYMQGLSPEANLKLALKHLGVERPIDVGLSDSVLK